MKFKRLAAAVMAATMCGSLFVGCGNAKKDDTAAGEEKITATIKVWGCAEDQADENGKWLQTMCDQFNSEHPDWDLTFEYGVCSEQDAGKIVPQDPENSGDVYFFANDQLQTLVDANAIAKLGGETADYVKKTNSDAIVDSVSVDGAVYGVPFTTNTWFMYYDKSVFSEDDVKNFDTMLEKAGEAGKKVSFKLTDSWYIEAFYVANGCTLFGDGTDTDAGIDFGGDKAAAVTEYLVDLAANPNFLVDADGSGLAGLGDSVAALFSGTWDAEAVKEKLGDNMGVAALPTVTIDGKEGQMKSFIGSKAIGVNPNAENQQVAMSLAAYLAGEKAQTAHYEMRNLLPSNINISLADDPIATAVTNVMTDTSIMQPLCKEMSNYWSPAENMGKNIQSGEVTKDNAAEKTEEMNTTMNTDVAE